MPKKAFKFNILLLCTLFFTGLEAMGQIPSSTPTPPTPLAPKGGGSTSVVGGGDAFVTPEGKVLFLDLAEREPIFVPDLPAFGMVKSQILQLSAYLPTLFDSLNDIFSSGEFSWYFTSKVLPNVPDERDGQEYDRSGLYFKDDGEEKILQAAVFLSSTREILINKDLLQKMPPSSQAFLLVHEALRALVWKQNQIKPQSVSLKKFVSKIMNSNFERLSQKDHFFIGILETLPELFGASSQDFLIFIEKNRKIDIFGNPKVASLLKQGLVKSIVGDLQKIQDSEPLKTWLNNFYGELLFHDFLDRFLVHQDGFFSMLESGETQIINRAKLVREAALATNKRQLNESVFVRISPYHGYFPVANLEVNFKNNRVYSYAGLLRNRVKSSNIGDANQFENFLVIVSFNRQTQKLSFFKSSQVFFERNPIPELDHLAGSDKKSSPAYRFLKSGKLPDFPTLDMTTERKVQDLDFNYLAGGVGCFSSFGSPGLVKLTREDKSGSVFRFEPFVEFFDYSPFEGISDPLEIYLLESLKKLPSDTFVFDSSDFSGERSDFRRIGVINLPTGEVENPKR